MLHRLWRRAYSCAEMIFMVIDKHVPYLNQEEKTGVATSSGDRKGSSITPLRQHSVHTW